MNRATIRGRCTMLARTVTLFALLLLCACASQVTTPDPAASITSEQFFAEERTIALLGATGMVGEFVLREALAKGFTVRALARTPAKLDVYRDQITVVQGDATDRATIATLLQGSDIVISALGPVKTDGSAASTISTTATGHLLDLMPEHAIERLLIVSGGAVDVPGDDRNMTGWMMQKMVALAMSATLQDKQAEYALLADSNLRWTLLRCPRIYPEEFSQAPRASLESPDSYSLKAGELARFLIEQIDADEYVGKAPFLESR